MHRLDNFPNNEMIAQYRQTFSTAAGLEALACMMWELGVFEQVSNGAEDVALKNYGIRLLTILSGGEPAKENIQAFIKQLMKQPLIKEKTE